MSILLSANGVTKSFGHLQVLDGIDFSIDTSEMVAITGKSGAGKSTFLHVLSTLETPDSGQIDILDKNVHLLSSKDISKIRNEEIGFIFQFHHLIHEFTAIENAMLPLLIGNENRKQAQEKAHEMLRFVGLSDRQHHLPNELSGGEQQRVAIARAIVHRPKIIFADEPTGNLDSENADSIFELFNKIRNELGSSFVIVTHDTHFAQKCDRIYTMVDGQILNS